MSKSEYDTLALGQIKYIRLEIPKIRSQMTELPLLVEAAPPEKLRALFGEKFVWASAYELTFNDLLALLMCALGKKDKLIEISQSSTPQEDALEWAKEKHSDEWAGDSDGTFEKRHVVGLTIALQRNILSVMIFHRTLNQLVADARNGSDDALFNAVRIDRSVVSCPTIADRISRADLKNDSKFFLRLGAALKGPSKKNWESYRDLRFAFHAMREIGFGNLSDEQMENLLVHTLKLYPNTPAARRNLRKQFTESRKIATTSN